MSEVGLTASDKFSFGVQRFKTDNHFQVAFQSKEMSYYK